MATSMIDLLSQQLDGDATRLIGRQLGVDDVTASRAVSSALPVLMGALARNASQPEGATSLLGALERDHDGAVLDDVQGFLGRGDASSLGAGILRHVFGRRQATVEQGLGRASGVDGAQMAQVLAMLAPLVMGALGRMRRERGIDAGGLGAALGQERATIERRAPEAGGLLGQLLDRDGDGQIADDVAKMGAGVLGSLFGGRR